MTKKHSPAARPSPLLRPADTVPADISTRRLWRITAITWLAGAAAAIILNVVIPGKPLTIMWAVSGLAAYLIAEAGRVRLPDGILVGLTHTMVVMISLSTGVRLGLLVILVGTPLAFPLLMLVNLRSATRTHNRLILRDSLVSSGIDMLSLLAGGLVFPGLLLQGAVLPVSAGRFPNLLGFTLVFFLVASLLSAAWLRLAGTPIREYLKRYELLLFLNRAAALLAAPFLVSVMRNINDVVILAGLVPVVALVVVLRAANLNQLMLGDRLADLRTLSGVGQALVANLDLDTLTEAIRAEIGKMLDTSGFYLALVDEAEGMLHFPLSYERGQRMPSSSRAISNGITEYLARTRESLVINSDFEKIAAALGINVRGTLPRAFLGAPILSGDEALGVIALRQFDQEGVYSSADLRLMETIAAQAGVALRNAQLYERSQRQAHELEALNRVALNLNQDLHYDNVIQTVCSATIRLMDADKAAVFLADEQGSTIDLAGSVGLSDRYQALSTRVPITPDGRFAAFLNNRPLVISDLTAEGRYEDMQLMASEEGFRAVLEVPLYTGTSVIGTLAAYYARPRTFSASEVDLMQTLGAQVAIAMQNARLFESTMTRSRELEALYSAGIAINASLSLVNVLRAVANSLLDALPFDSCTAWISTDGGESLRGALRLIQDGDLLRDETLNGQDPLLLTDLSVLYRAFRMNAPLQIEEIGEEWPEQQQMLQEACGLMGGLVLPLAIQGAPVGMIVAGWRNATHPIEPHHIKIAEALANHAAVALDNARMFEQTDVALQQRLDELAVLEGLSHRMTRRLDLNSVIEQVVLAAADATGAELVEVALYNPESRALELSARRVRGEWEHGGSWGPGGLTALALEQGQPLIIADVKREPQYVEAFPATQSELVVPIMLEDQRLGVINLESELLGGFTREHARFISNLAKQAAIAIENARLFERVARQAEEFRTLRSISLELLSTADLRQLLQMIAKHAMDHTSAEDVHIYLYDEEKDQLEFGTSRWRSGEIDVEFSKPRAQGLTHTVARSGERIIVRDINSHPLYADVMGQESWQQNPVQSMIGIPLRMGNEVIGVFNLAFRNPHTITDDMLHFMDLLAVEAAVAIGNARYAERLRTARDRLQAILDSIYDAIVMFDSEGRLVMANQRLDYLLNVRTEDLMNKHFLEVLSALTRGLGVQPPFSRPKVAALLRQARQSPRALTRRSYTLEKPTMRAIEEISTAVVGDNDALMGRLFILRDVTQQYELELYRQDMSHMLVHDLRSPLGGVITGLQMALDELENGPAEMDIEILLSTLRVSMKSAYVLLNLIENLLDVNRLEAGEMPLRLAEANLQQIASLAYERLAHLAMDADIGFDIRAPEGLPPIIVDAEKIGRVLANLLDNAVRYTPTDGTIIVHIVPGPGVQEVIVEDSGPGVPVEDRERIFERFVQLDVSKRKRGSKGSGLGLTFCRLAVEAHGGRIWVTDGELGGAAFHFTLPSSLKPTDDLS